MSGFTIWLTGLSGAGKSTIAGILTSRLEAQGLKVETLDGDVVREHLSRGLTFSREDRDLNVERIGWVASRLTRHGAAVVVSAISPFAQARADARAMVEEFGPFLEVFVDASVETCTARDVKGLYRRALAGEIANFTGVSDPYEAPVAPEVHLSTADETPDESVEAILASLADRGLIRDALPGR
jgi:adenylylsulfate kinase